MRRQKMKMGTCSALRKIAFTAGNGVEIIRASRSRPKRGHDLREIPSNSWSEQHLITRERDPRLNGA